MIRINNIPLRVPITKKKMGSLNLNAFRNYHYQVLNKMKKYIHQWVRDNKPKQTKIKPPVELIYTVYRSSKRRVDLGNIGSVVDKMVSDAIVLIGILPDDNTDYIKKVTFIDGGIDKENPRCDLKIRSLKMEKTCMNCQKDLDKTCDGDDVKECYNTKTNKFENWFPIEPMKKSKGSTKKSK